MKSNALIDMEKTRRFLNGATSREYRSTIGQFFTPTPIAIFMASLFNKNRNKVRILDAGAGTGALFTALVENLCNREKKPESIEVTAYENDQKLLPYLEDATDACKEMCVRSGIKFSGVVYCEDFISSSVARLNEGLFSKPRAIYTHVILNPPYKKISGDSNARRLLNSVGMETSNLYSAFVWLSAMLLDKSGELVAITPRSFCNGPYFRRFRKSLLEFVSLRRIHVFHSRKEAFADDAVLQENIIFYGVRGQGKSESVEISVTDSLDFNQITIRQIPKQLVVSPGDTDSFIHLIEDNEGLRVMEQAGRFTTTLAELGLDVSTGRIVDFRVRDYILQEPEADTAPLIYPSHFNEGFVGWPNVGGKKPNAILVTADTFDMLVPEGNYVVTKRFTAKEERRRVVAVVYDKTRIAAPLVGFENHLNYFHTKRNGIPLGLAKGLAVYLNSTLFDRHFRLFSGHTQVNATDLRKMRYPSREQILKIGEIFMNILPEQEMIDVIIEQECLRDAKTAKFQKS